MNVTFNTCLFHSAGVGRSGTFIALDTILQSIVNSDYVDIFNIVYEMRKERVYMVQNEQQYICIHQCLLAVLEGRENDQLPKEIHDNHGFDGKLPNLIFKTEFKASTNCTLLIYENFNVKS